MTEKHAQGEPAAPSAPDAPRPPLARRLKFGPVDLLAAGMWLVIALLVVGFALRTVPFTGGGSHRAAVVTPARATEAALAAPSATAAAGPSATATSKPQILTGVVPDAGLLRPGATMIERVDLDPPGRARSIVAYSSAAGVDGCPHPYVDVLRSTAGGAWQPVWAATSSPAGAGPLIAAVNRGAAGCFPRVSLFAVRGLGAGRPGLALGLAQADGSQRVVVIDPLGNPVPTLLDSLDLAPGETMAVEDADPLAIDTTQAQPAPDSLESGAWSGQPIGQLYQRYVWDRGALAGEGLIATPNCLSGTIAARTTGSESIVLFRCPDGVRFAAARLAGETVLGGGVRADDLQPGDDVQVVLVETSDDPAQAVPLATRLASSSAEARYLTAAVATEPPATPSVTRAPAPPPTVAAATEPRSAGRTSGSLSAPATTVAPPVRAPVVATPPPVPATAVASEPATVAPTAVLVVTLVPTRTVPPQPTATATVRTVPPQPR